MPTKPPTFTPRRLASACGGRLLNGPPHVQARGVSTDSRTLRGGEVFFALVGGRFDGHRFLPAAVDAGAAACVVERIPEAWTPPRDLPVIRVADTEHALLQLAGWHRSRLGAMVAGVTGSYGKSTVKSMLGAILSRHGRCTTAPASYNNRIGVALTLLEADRDSDFIVVEMGTNHPGEIDELAAAARPDAAVITAIGPVHLEGLGNLEGVREAKAEIIPHVNPAGTLILNADQDSCASLAARFAGRTRTFGAGEDANVSPTAVTRAGGGWAFSIDGVPFRVRGGRYNVMNAAAAVALAQELGVSTREAAQALADFVPPGMRYQRIEMANATWILDCYNSNPPALRAALESFESEFCACRRVVVCGDMLELGPAAPRLHREAGAALAAAGIDLLVAVGNMAEHVLEGWYGAGRTAQDCVAFPSVDDAWRPLLNELQPGDAVLLKGSRGVRLETVVERIREFLNQRREESAA